MKMGSRRDILSGDPKRAEGRFILAPVEPAHEYGLGAERYNRLLLPLSSGEHAKETL